MVDPVTAFAAANAAFKGVQKLVAAGREVSDVMGQIAEWTEQVSHIVEHDTKNSKPPLFKKLVSSKSVEAEALQRVVRSQKLAEQRKEIRELLIYAYGREAFDMYLDTQKKIKAARAKAIADQAARQKKVVENTLIGLILLSAVALVGYGFVWLGGVLNPQQSLEQTEH